MDRRLLLAELTVFLRSDEGIGNLFKGVLNGLLVRQHFFLPVGAGEPELRPECPSLEYRLTYIIVAYDAPFQTSRIAAKWNRSTKRRRAFSFYFRLCHDKKTGAIRPSGFEPGISVESLDAAKAI